jgi:hypothetical protein
MASSGMICHVALVITNVSEELSASTVRLTRIGELGIMLAVTSNGCTQLVTANVIPSSPILSPWWWRRYVPPKRPFLREPQELLSHDWQGAWCRLEYICRKNCFCICSIYMIVLILAVLISEHNEGSQEMLCLRVGLYAFWFD